MDSDPQANGAVSFKLPSTPRHPDVPQTVGFIYSSEMTQHFNLNDDDHPECPERIISIWNALNSQHCIEKMKELPIRPVHKQEALLVHSEDHWNKIMAFQHITGQQVMDSAAYYEQLSVYVMDGTTRAALLSCGGVIEACLAVASPTEPVTKALAIVRPPGHHAEPAEHMGFCFFNNVAIAARVVQETTSIKRILILDWDVHHGNGTQHAFNDDPSVLYISIHRYEDGQFYPCSDFGGMESCGEGPGLGFSVNVPWPCAYMTDADYLYAFQCIVMPIAVEFAPELVIISAGFDAAKGDDMGDCQVTPGGYAHMTHMLAGLAGGRLVVALEGGYDLKSLSDSTLAVTQVLLGGSPPVLPPLNACAEATETIWQVAKLQKKYWKNVQAHVCEPRPDSILTVSVSEILKAHRQHDLYKTHGLLEIPLCKDDIPRFASQVLSTPDLMDKNTLVVLVHEFGNLQAELQSSTSCDLDIERSYLIDMSRRVISWVRRSGYSLVDINLFPKPPQALLPARNLRLDHRKDNDLLTYVWDNYISICGAQRIVFIGNGRACPPMITFLDARWFTTDNTVATVIQIVGMAQNPGSPSNDENFREWYLQHSLVIAPSEHAICRSPIEGKQAKHHGNVMGITDEVQPARVMLKALPGIQDWVKSYLTRNPLQNTHRTNAQ